MTAQYGPHRWSAGYHDNGDNDAFRGASFTVADLAGARFVDCDLSGVKVVDSWLVGVDMSGYVGTSSSTASTSPAFVEAELDRRHPERVQLREIRAADDFRAMWDTIERLWAGTVARAERLPEPARHERVDGEWSFVETMRHLVFITDSWASRTILDEPMPFHRLGLPQTAYAPADAEALGMDLDDRPSYAEVMAARADRMALVRGILGRAHRRRPRADLHALTGARLSGGVTPGLGVPRRGHGGGVRAPPVRDTRPRGAGRKLAGTRTTGQAAGAATHSSSRRMNTAP